MSLFVTEADQMAVQEALRAPKPVEQPLPPAFKALAPPGAVQEQRAAAGAPGPVSKPATVAGEKAVNRVKQQEKAAAKKEEAKKKEASPSAAPALSPLNIASLAGGVFAGFGRKP